MIKTHKSKLRLLPLLVAVALILTSLPVAAFAQSSFSAAVWSKKMKVYADAQGKEYLGSLPKKTIVTVKDHANGVAKISYNGMTGYAKVSDMRSVESIAEEAETSKSTRVYEEADASSRSAKVKAGVKVYVLAVKNGIAMVEKDGKVGYMDGRDLVYTENGEPVVESAAAPAPDTEPEQEEETSGNTFSGSELLDALPDSVVDGLPDSVVDQVENSQYSYDDLDALMDALQEAYENNQAQQDEEEEPEEQTESLADAFSSGKYSNEKLCYMFAKEVMGYNTAAAAGLLSNISAESGFRPNANGDSGRSYGICQWFSSRKTRLLNWCANNNMDPAELLSQLYFLKYELETYYPSVNRYMKGVEDSAQGAFDAAYYFCYHFEAPANKASKSTTRGNNAKNTFYPRYA